MIAQALKLHQDAVMRPVEVQGLGVDSAQQIIAEVGAQASTFSSVAELTSWVGTVSFFRACTPSLHFAFSSKRKSGR